MFNHSSFITGGGEGLGIMKIIISYILRIYVVISFAGLQLSFKSATLIVFLFLFSSHFISLQHLALPLCVKRATQIKLHRLTASAAVHKFPHNHSGELRVETDALLRLAAPRAAG